ncbi:hypothetical protein [Halobaculum roseum]|uniref:Halobacterial output domain-containing protein n=1 Tax=Halobaculum roseum TaxID=2175149 RepID=A0ABD5MUG6_9EURY|nr:hypothetical protein [Halobaculum roseum]QZY04570.1 hypothetical protein K6T36_16555 [Halobaculum roseum]
MESPAEDGSSITARERSPLSDADKRDIARTVDRAVAYGSDGLETDEWSALSGCRVAFVVRDEHIEVRLRYDADRLPGPVVVPGADEDGPSLVRDGDTPTAFVALSEAHGALYEDLTDSAGHAVDPYAVAVPDTPVARTVADGTVTFVATLSVLTGEGSADRRTYDW